jgi:poly(3-hydroxybutyrate) depolymerase
MHRIRISALAASAAIAICALSTRAIAQDQTIRFGGVARHFILHVPAGLSKPPVVFVLHGTGMTGAQMVTNTKMDAVADKEKFLAVYPNGINNSWQTAPATDFEFLLAIVDTLDARYHIDRERVYVSGFSQGGVMAYHAACRYADKFAAVAPVSGRIQETCTPKRTIPLLAIFGTADVLSPAAFMQDMGIIANFDGCPKTPVITSPYPVGNPGSAVTHMEFGPCRDGIKVWADSIKGGPHEWPMNAMNGSEEVWGFFKEWTLHGAVTAARPLPEERRVRFLAAYAGGVLKMDGVEAGARIRILDHQGRLVFETKAVVGDIPFRAKSFGVYQVVVVGKSGSSSFLMSALP